MDVINIQQKFDLFSDHWNPKIIGSLNGQDVKLAKVKGEFVWHDHKHEDELFLVIKGELDIHFEHEVKTIKEGELIIVPKGVRHKPVAKDECWVMLYEPHETKHTGAVDSDLTVLEYEQI